MTKKKIIGLCIGAVVLAVATAGVKEGSWLMKHRRMQNEFTHEMNAFTTKTNAELIQPTIVAEDDIYGWFFHEEDDGLYAMVEELAPKIIGEERHIYKGVSANVDFYSGFVYSMLDLPLELYTPMFACARIVGWSAHRMEELINTDKIIRPAYKSVKDEVDYVPLENR